MGAYDLSGPRTAPDRCRGAAIILNLIRTFAGTLGRLPFAARFAGLALGDPMQALGPKPFKRRQLVYDLPFRRLAIVNDREMVETVMLDRAGEFPKSAIIRDLLAPLIGEGVFGQPDGEVVKHTRRLMARALAAVSEERIASVSGRIARDYMGRWLEGSPRAVAVGADFSRMTVDIVSECTLGGRFDERQSARFTALFSEYHRRAKPVLLMLSRDEPRTREAIVREAGLERIGREMRALIRERFIDGICEPAPFRDALLQDGPVRGDAGDRALDEIAVMLLAGHETTASTLSWLAFELADRAGLQEDAAVAAEAAHPPMSGASTAEDITAALTNETLRLYPPIGFFLRETTAEVTLQDTRLPPGSLMLVAPRTLHRHADYWRNADDFDPSRWLGAAPQRAAFLPFGMGARACPGARFAAIELRVIVGTLLRELRLGRVAGKAPKPLWNLTSRPHPDVVLQVSRRAQVQV